MGAKKDSKFGIRICSENEKLLLASLRSANKNARTYTYKTYDDLLHVVQLAEQELAFCKLYGNASYGARYMSVSGYQIRGYDYLYACTQVVITKRHNGDWYLTTADKYYRHGGRSADKIGELIITEKQREIAVNRTFRNCMITTRDTADHQYLRHWQLNR